MNPAPSVRPARSAIFFGACLLFLAGSAAPLAAQEPPPPSDSFHYKIQVQLVLVSANVFANDGQPVTSLGEDAFQVLEDGKQRPIKLFEKKTGIPLQLALLVDSSLSAASQLEAEKAAMARFIQRVLEPKDFAALYGLTAKAEPVVDFTDNESQLATAVQAIKVSGGTALYDSIIAVSDKLREREGRRVLVIISDGNDTTSKNDFQTALRAAQEAEATIFGLVVRTIPGESGRNVRGEHVLISLADLTGGRVFFADRVAELDHFFAALSEMLRTQYLLGYEPAPPHPRPEFRAIEVRVKGGDYTVQHRKGYYAEGMENR